jgi:hypothetical protein
MEATATNTKETSTMSTIECYKNGHIRQGSDRHGVFFIARNDNGQVCCTDRITSARRFLGIKEVAA